MSEPSSQATSGGPELERSVHLTGAVLLGLGSIIGTGVFVSLGLAAGMAGSAILWTLALGGVLALLNGLSVAQLSADLPLSGGTYEFAYRHLHPWAGFSAGWF